MSKVLQALDTANIPNQPQTTQASTKKAPTAVKRKLPFNGAELDLMGALPATPEVVDALRNRILQLEDQLEVQQSQTAASLPQPAQGRPAKKARTAAASDVTAEPAGSVPTAQDPKKKKMQIKKVVDQLKRECKAASVKFQGAPKTVKFDEIMEYDDFQQFVGGQGELIQPTPTNNPKSTVTIIKFNASQVLSLLGSNCTKGLKGNLWTRGGAPTFAKSIKMGQCDLRINQLEVNYSKNGMKCTYKFEVEDVDGEESRGGELGPTPRAQWVWTKA